MIGVRRRSIGVRRRAIGIPPSPYKPPPLYILDDDDAGVSIIHAGDRKNPITVEDFPNSHRAGDRNNPVSLSDEDTDAIVQIFSVDDPSDDVIVLDYNVDDPKGKRPIQPARRRRRSSHEPGESSSAPAPDIYCSVCMESKPSNECFPIKACAHTYCAHCVSQYVAAKVEDNQSSIGCPHPDCKDGFLDLENCQPILSNAVFDRWGALLCEELLNATKLYCPYKNCSALLINDGEVALTSVECPHCYRMFCAQCKVQWHTDFTCEEYQKLGPDRNAEDLMLMKMAKNQSWQRCPKCSYYVERTEGCPFMKCRCGTLFCYTCGSITKADHYCAKCMKAPGLPHVGWNAH